MALNITKEIAQMERMTVDQLRAKFATVFNEETPGRHKQWLVKRIAWRMQANDEGDLSERARHRAAELANDADLRVMAPRQPDKLSRVSGRTQTSSCSIKATNDLPLPGTMLTRQYKGQKISVTVLRAGFEYQGERYKSLTAIAKAVTGSHWNGRAFFGLRKKGARA